MQNDPILEQYPFLLNLPKSVLKELDLHVLLIPSAEQKEKIRLLEEETRSFIVLYKKNYEPKGKHLCKTIQSAKLDLNHIESISRLEREIRKENEPIVVAYHKPVLLFNADRI